jgi:hypothetical protein
MNLGGSPSLNDIEKSSIRPWNIPKSRASGKPRWWQI